jgi:hydroxymethylbilane synthase
LALAQSEDVLKHLRRRWPSERFSLVIVKTKGDEFQSVELFKKTHVGVFTKAIEEKLLAGEIDAAVHSLKDLPTDLAAGLVLAAVPKRLDVCDVLISRKRWTIKTIPAGSVVGTGSPRRKSQVAFLRPDLVLKDMRGNLDTRVGKVLKKEYDAVIVADAGLRRLGKYRRYAAPIRSEALLPAVGQAALALQVRADDLRSLKLLRALNHTATELEVKAERALLKSLHGGCRVPVGVLSRTKGKKLHLCAAVFSVKNTARVFGEITGRLNNAEALGRKLAATLLKKGAGRFLKEARL